MNKKIKDGFGVVGGKMIKNFQKLKQNPNAKIEKAQNEFLKIYSKKSGGAQISSSLKILKQIFKTVVQDRLLSSDFIKNCKMIYLNSIDNMQDALINGKKQYVRHIKSLTDNMEPHYKKLVDIELKLEYLQNMKKPEQKGTTKNRLSLLL